MRKNEITYMVKDPKSETWATASPPSLGGQNMSKESEGMSKEQKDKTIATPHKGRNMSKGFAGMSKEQEFKTWSDVRGMKHEPKQSNRFLKALTIRKT